MFPIVTPAEMADIDAAAPEPVEVLIERAGWQVARVATQMLGGTYGKRVVVLAGRGNNGADGRVAGRFLERRGVRVNVVDPTGKPWTNQSTRRDPSEYPRPGAPELGAVGDLVIDAAYGTGLNRPYDPPRIGAPTPVLAVDIPSGLSGSTGRRLGTPLVATRTVTFAALKPGHLIGAGPGLCGDLEVVDIGLDTSRARAWLVTEADVTGWLSRRPRDAHKWQSAVRLVAGSAGMSGSADLATAGALRSGAGYVRRSTPGIDPKASGFVASGPIEAVTTALSLDDWADDVLVDIDRFGALVVGPGLGTDPVHAAQLARIVAAPVPVVVDGDGLRALGSDPASILTRRPSDLPPVVLTPHDGEFAGLGGSIGDEIDRFEAARELAARTRAIVLYKGSTTIVAHPDGRVLVVRSGDERLATAGTGDVLAGVIGAFMARGVAPFEAAAAGAWVHGRAGCSGLSTGLVAGDLPLLVASLLSSLGHNGTSVHDQGTPS